MKEDATILEVTEAGREALDRIDALRKALERLTRCVDMAQRADRNKAFIVDCAAMQEAVRDSKAALSKALTL